MEDKGQLQNVLEGKVEEIIIEIYNIPFECFEIYFCIIFMECLMFVFKVKCFPSSLYYSFSVEACYFNGINNSMGMK